MKSVFIADINTYVPTNDCYIMAQASIEGICLVTANGKDFIFNEKSKNENNARTLGIMEINKQKRYCAEDLNTIYTTPRPIHIRTLGPLLSKDNNQEFKSTEAFNDFDKGSEIL